MDTDLITKYRSHPNKLLFHHLKGVADKAKRYTPSKAVEMACLFHDLGKINPHFQNKLDGKKTGYDNHAYLSAYAWLLFVQHNLDFLKKEFDRECDFQAFSIATMIAKHHSDLPNLRDGFFKEEERKRLLEFLEKSSFIPVSDFLQLLFPHKAFDLFPEERIRNITVNDIPLKFNNIFRKLENPLRFFHDTQFGFACLLEADKRDAGDNLTYLRDEIGKELHLRYDSSLSKKFAEYETKVGEGNAKLNELRAKIRNEATENLRKKLDAGERVFTLTSPTGSGKTMMLFALANEIMKRNPNHDILYALPFLSITAKEVFGENVVMRIDSKSENKAIQELLERSDSDPEKLQELLRQVFSEETFDHPFIITTFVRFFETLASNRNSELLKLPNFSKRIFLIDEFQALPPRLYIFFAALLDEFCKRFDSYAILSTATMPYLEIEENSNSGKAARNLFKNYPPLGKAKERELVDAPKYFSEDIFDRYAIQRIENENFTIEDLAAEIRSQTNSCLVILNTVQDTKDLFAYFAEQNDEYVLLNTHFHLEDRKEKIAYCKERLAKGERIVLISTQLIEAGVDIDFPVLYRDICPLPSLIQSAGRCNRNGVAGKGKVYLFELRKEGKLRAKLIYRDEVGKRFLEFCKKEIICEISEKDLFNLQKQFFETEIGQLIIGLHYQSGLDEKHKCVVNGQKIDAINMVECIENAEFETLGQFRLIDEKKYGEEFRYYIPRDENDDSYEKLEELQDKVKGRKSFADAKKLKIELETHLRAMQNRIVAIRLAEDKFTLAPKGTEPIFGIRKIDDYQNDYSSITGIRLDSLANALI